MGARTVTARARWVVDLLRSTHPGPTVAVTIFATALAVAAGWGARAPLATGAVLAGQLSIGWGNDLIDAARDRRAARVDKPIVTGAVTEQAVRAAALTAVAVCVVASLAAGLAAGLVHLLAVGGAWAYNLGLKRTAASVVPFLVSFALLPAFVVLAVGGVPPWWLVSGAGLLGAGAHFANALPDLETDAVTAVRGLPQRLGRRRSAAAAAALLGAGALLVPVGLGWDGLSWLPRALLVAALGLAAAAGGVGWARATRSAFTLSMAAAGAVVALLVSTGDALR
ncbi:hypothetical protein BH23ACT8_BH23ACT8_23400 [soil metagenome]